MFTIESAVLQGIIERKSHDGPTSRQAIRDYNLARGFALFSTSYLPA
jgi:hypothetical protein